MSTPLETPAAPPQPQHKLPGPRILLMGESGTGKTNSLRTLISAGITPFVEFLEPGMETIGDIFNGKQAHYKYRKAFTANWLQLKEMARVVNALPLDGLAKLQDAQKTKHVAFMDLISDANDFKCDCCQRSWGDVTKWNTDRAFCIDGLTGLSDMAMALLVGSKPLRSMSDWGIAQNMIMGFLNYIISDVTCTFVLISHQEREKDEVTGGTSVTVSTLGQKLAPKIPAKFSDVISVERVGTKFTWSTAATNAVTKTRNLSIASGLDASFVPLIEGWKKKGGRIEATL